MRLRRLDLLRYGHFTDRSFELPAGEADFHIVFGPNEAGKSTALSAIEDLLFGIHMHSPYGFLHDYASMRIGAVLENSSETLEMVRRKGNKDTLLGTDGLPMAGGEGVLRPYLAGADRVFFERMFSLDHGRLEKGGQDILEAKDDVGQMLFSAGAGIAGLREKLAELNAESDALWTGHRAKGRRFYQVDDKLKSAEKDLREQTLTASKWRELKRAFDDSEDAYRTIDAAFRQVSAERSQLSRIRRVLRDVRRKQQIDGLLVEMGDVVSLPEDALRLVEAAERRDAEAATGIATLQGQLEQAKCGLEKLTYDVGLVQRADDIRQLHERRIEIRREKADLPKREAELHAAEVELLGFARELGWDQSDVGALIDQIPPRAKVNVVRALLAQKGELEAEAAAQAKSLREGQEAHDRLDAQLTAMGDLADISRLALVLKNIRGQGDIGAKLRAAGKDVKESQGRLARLMASLHPAVSDEQTLLKTPVPSRAEVQAHQGLSQDWERRVREARQKNAATQQQLDQAVAAFERRVRDEHVVTAEALNEARSRRDDLWQLVKLKHVKGQAVPADQGRRFSEELDDLAGALEPAIIRADELADQRFDHAEVAGQLAEVKRQIDLLEIQLEQAQKNEAELIKEGNELKAAWAKMWREAPFEVLEPEAMLEWLDERKKVLETLESREASQGALDAARDEEREARELLLREMTAIGIDCAGLENDALSLVLERAGEEHQKCDSQHGRKSQLDKDVHSAAEGVARRVRELAEAKEGLAAWQSKWEVALRELGLSAETTVEAANALVDVIDQMRESAGRINSLKHDRIDKIRRDAADFETAVAALLLDVAKDLEGRPAEDAVLAVERRLEEAERLQGLRGKQEEAIEALTGQIAELEDKRQQSKASITHLMHSAGAESIEALKEAIGQSDQHRALVREREQVIAKLLQDGDGLDLEALEQECDGVEIDAVTARDASIETELEELRKQQADAAEERSKARDAFQAIGGDDAAAQAAAQKQEALAEMEEVARRFVRVKTSALLLQWAIDRYRREKQAPLLKRAGELFEIMTGGSFVRLDPAFDDQDKAHLTGVRPDGQVVPVSGMSTGSADQLYLALRVAAIEDYLQRADALPFVADDLFVNFDDERAAAGFRLLGELGQKTQVLFFTHHQHLVDIARAALGASVSVVALKEQADVAAA